MVLNSKVLLDLVGWNKVTAHYKPMAEGQLKSLISNLPTHLFISPVTHMMLLREDLMTKIISN